MAPRHDWQSVGLLAPHAESQHTPSTPKPLAQSVPAPQGCPSTMMLPESYSSAVATAFVMLTPPATRALPSWSSVAVWNSRAIARDPAADQLSATGSYSSAV